MFNFFKYTSYILLIIGALNWGLIGFFDYDLIAVLFGDMTLISRIIYSLIGLSAFVSVITISFCNKRPLG